MSLVTDATRVCDSDGDADGMYCVMIVSTLFIWLVPFYLFVKYDFDFIQMHE